MRNRIIKVIDLEAVDAVLYDIEQHVRNQDAHPDTIITVPEWLRRDIDYIHNVIRRDINNAPRA